MREDEIMENLRGNFFKKLEELEMNLGIDSRICFKCKKRIPKNFKRCPFCAGTHFRCSHCKQVHSIAFLENGICYNCNSKENLSKS